MGRGITFDSGGYREDLPGMLTMKHDMGGAAIVTGALALAILRGLDKAKSSSAAPRTWYPAMPHKLGDIPCLQERHHGGWSKIPTPKGV